VLFPRGDHDVNARRHPPIGRGAPADASGPAWPCDRSDRPVPARRHYAPAHLGRRAVPRAARDDQDLL